MNTLINSLFNPAPSGLIPDKIKHKRRFAFVFLVDISGSTGEGGNNADIHAINTGLSKIFELMKNPPPASDLALHQDQIDVCVISYHNKQTVEIDWALASTLPSSINLTAQGGTSTASAFEFALAKIAERLRTYKAPDNKVTCGMSHIIHITDGAPTDMNPGDARWMELSAKLGGINGVGNPEKQIAGIIHYVTPNGTAKSPTGPKVMGPQGTPISGQEALALLTGPKTVFEVATEPTAIADFVKMVTVILESATQIAGSMTAVEAAQNFVAGHPTGGVRGTII